MTRRELLSRVVPLTGVGVAGAVGVPVLVHTLSPVLEGRPAEMWRPIGPTDGFPEGEVQRVLVDVPREDWARSLQEKGVYVWHSPDEGLVVYSRNCTDLSCPVEYDPGSSWFFCPCHGGIFSTDGTPRAGPPNRPLYRYATRVRDGLLEIDVRSLPPHT
jgi:menaquinol-cytochrome c reductase iron-sulfur subunit